MSHAIRTGTTGQIAFFRAYDSDGTAKVDLTSATTGLTMSVFRVGLASVSIASLTNKAADNTAHAAGAIRAVQGNLYTIDLPDAAVASQCPSICVKGTYTGGVIEGVPHPLVGYDGTSARVGASDGTGVTLAANQDVRNVSGTVSDSAGTTTLLARLTSTRAGNLDLLDVAISTLQSQITALNNLSAKCNWFGSLLLEIPDSGSRDYIFELVVKDDEDKLANLDASPTIALVNSSGTDRSSLITTGIASVATGRYTLTITVGTSTTNEALTLRATGTVSGETRYAVLTTQVVDYDSATIINSIYTRLGAPAGASIAADIADIPTVAEFEARTLAAASYGTAANQTTILARLGAWTGSGINTVLGAFRALMAKASELTPTDISSGTAFDNTTDSLEAIRDRGDAAWITGSGGGGGGDATAANQTTIINHLTDIKGTGWSSTTDTLEKIRDSITNALASLIATVGITPGSITGFPASLSIGDSYTEDCDRAIHLFVRDDSDDPITAVGDHLFTDTDFEAVVIITQSGRTGRVTGSATWVDASPSESYLKIELPSSETRRAAIGAATVQILLKWAGAQYTLPSVSTSWVAQI